MTKHIYIATLTFGPVGAPTHTQEFPFKSSATRTGTVTEHGRREAEATLGTFDFMVTNVRPATIADFEAGPSSAKKVVRVNELPAEMQVRIALEPVTCIDCEQYVPYGWIDQANGVVCPKNFGASGVQYGHRIPNYIYTSIVDKIVNLYVFEGLYSLDVASV